MTLSIADADEGRPHAFEWLHHLWMRFSDHLMGSLFTIVTLWRMQMYRCTGEDGGAGANQRPAIHSPHCRVLPQQLPGLSGLSEPGRKFPSGSVHLLQTDMTCISSPPCSTCSRSA